MTTIRSYLCDLRWHVTTHARSMLLQ